jgi:predicted negative regulator of RcsB-dependent stress response
MNQRLTRKDMKRDELASAMGRGVEYAESHARTLFLAIGGALLALLLIGAGYMFTRHRREQANVALAKAVKVYEAPVDAAAGAKPDDPQNPSFADETARRNRAKALFEGVRSDYGSSDAADVAGLYLAQIAVAEGQLDRARQMWQDFADEHKGEMLATEARLNLLRLDRKQGKGDQVAKELSGWLDQADAPLPQDVVLFELGSTQADLGRKPDAIQSYQRILDEFPQSPYAQEAQTKIRELDPTRAPAGGMGGMGGVGGVGGMGLPGAPGGV